jgi:hypothetical protein
MVEPMVDEDSWNQVKDEDESMKDETASVATQPEVIEQATA